MVGFFCAFFLKVVWAQAPLKTKFLTGQAGGQEMKKVVMIIAQKNFRDEELLIPKQVLEDAGCEVKVAAFTQDYAQGMLGAKIKPDLTIEELSPFDFDAVVFIGGSGASVYWDNAKAHKIALDASAANKIVGAICIASVILAKAGLLKGKSATVWSSEAGKLQQAGANYTGGAVVRDGNIITAAGPFAAKEFGEELLKALE